MIGRFIRGWNQFFFAPVSSLPLGVFRFAFGMNALIMYSLRLADWRFYFTDEGFVPNAAATEILPEFFRPAFTWFPVSEFWTLGLHVVFLLALVGLTFGFLGRVSSLVAFILHLAFVQRNFSIVYGADIISSFLFFYLAITDSSWSFSVRSFLRGRRGLEAPAPCEWVGWLTTMGTRLIQIQMCVLYGFTGFEKLKGPTWWDGTAVWAVLGNQQLMMIDASWLMRFPLAIAFMTFSTLLFEIYFPVLVWNAHVRPWLLAFGVMLHVMIALTVGLVFFSLVMVTTYFVYLDPEWLRSKLARVGLPPEILRD